MIAKPLHHNGRARRLDESLKRISAEADRTAASGMRVLLIQKPFRRLKRVLEKQGHIVDTALDGAEADHKARSRGCELVVLDFAFSGLDGVSLVKSWRSGGMHADVVVLASRHTLKNKAEVLDAGADVLVMEPYSSEELLAQIRALLRRTQPERNPLQHIYDLEIDPLARMVRRAGRTVKLTRGEYDLLQYLAANRGKVVGRSMIWEQLYGEHGEITSNVIDVCIHALRAKIDKGFDLPLILTRWGSGYMLRGDS